MYDRSKFNASKYSNWYFNIISNIVSQHRVKSKGIYYEKHHILPKSLYPEFGNMSECKWNCVLLTYREHFVLHWLLTKMCIDAKEIRKMKYAFNSMVRSSKKHERITSSRQRETAKKHFIEALKSRGFTEEHRAKISASKRGVSRSAEHNTKIADAKRGKKLKYTEESKLRHRLATHTFEANSKRSKKMSSKRWITNGVCSMRIDEDKELPTGFIYGR